MEGKKEPRIIELEELAEFGDEDAQEIAKSDLYKEDVKTFKRGGGVDARGCGAVVRGKKVRGNILIIRWMLQTSQNMYITFC